MLLSILLAPFKFLWGLAVVVSFAIAAIVLFAVILGSLFLVGAGIVLSIVGANPAFLILTFAGAILGSAWVATVEMIGDL